MFVGLCIFIILLEIGRWEWLFKVKDRRFIEIINGKKYVIWLRKFGVVSVGRLVR